MNSKGYINTLYKMYFIMSLQEFYMPLTMPDPIIKSSNGAGANIIMVSINEKQIKNEFKTFIEQKLCPNVYAVGTLKQGIKTRTQGHFLGHKYIINETWTVGSREIYEKEYNEFIRRLSRIYCKKAYKRHKRLFANAATLEGGTEGMRYHINMMFRCPTSVSFSDFEKTVRKSWTEGAWMLSDIIIEKRTGDCVGYSLKTGSDALLLESMSF